MQIYYQQYQIGQISGGLRTAAEISSVSIKRALRFRWRDKISR